MIQYGISVELSWCKDVWNLLMNKGQFCFGERAKFIKIPDWVLQVNSWPTPTQREMMCSVNWHIIFYLCSYTRFQHIMFYFNTSFLPVHSQLHVDLQLQFFQQQCFMHVVDIHIPFPLQCIFSNPKQLQFMVVPAMPGFI